MEDVVTPGPEASGGVPARSSVMDRDLREITSRLDTELTSLSGRSLLITGGAGFLGHYLAQVPLHWNETSRGERSPIRVTVCDNFMRGMPAWLGDRRGDPHLEVVQLDVSRGVPTALVDDHAFFIHAASIASPTYYRKHPLETMDANVMGLRTLLDACARRNDRHRPVEGFLHFSSSEIYGNPEPEHIPTPEDYPGRVSCTGPRACYDESKRYSETLCAIIGDVHGLPVTMVRPFNNYGPGLSLSDRRVVADFARDILKGRDITLLSDGSPTRTFCYVGDAVVGYYRALVGGRRGEAYNIGTDGPEVSMGELAERMTEVARRLFGYAGEVRQRSSGDPHYLTDNPTRRCPDLTKARTHLGYEPQVGLEEGLERTLRWYAETQGANP